MDFSMVITAIDPLPLVTTVSLRADQFNARHKPFLADYNMPKFRQPDV